MIELSADISVRRSTNEWGTIIWQLGEVWATGGWGTLEYEGQWKPIHHMLQKHLFADIFTTCTANATCMLRNNNGIAKASATVSMWSLLDGTLTPIMQSGGPVSSPIFFFTGASSSWPAPLLRGEAVLRIETSSSSSSSPASVSQPLFLPLVIPSSLRVSTNPQVILSFASHPSPVVKISTSAPLAYGFLSTDSPGHFEDNILFFGPGSIIVPFIPWGGISSFNFTLFQTSTIFDHM